jgi:hypothetical protein
MLWLFAAAPVFAVRYHTIGNDDIFFLDDTINSLDKKPPGDEQDRLQSGDLMTDLSGAPISTGSQPRWRVKIPVTVTVGCPVHGRRREFLQQG